MSANGWRHAVLALASDLESLGKSTEGEFLSIGEKLQDFYQRAGDISKISSTVARMMSGEELGAAIEGFRDVVDRMKRLEGESRRNTKTLRDVLENISRLNHHVDGFRKTIRHLRVLSVSTRIESARLGITTPTSRLWPMKWENCLWRLKTGVFNFWAVPIR